MAREQAVMMNKVHLLRDADGDPVSRYNIDGKSDVLLVCEHASNRFPFSLEKLGLSEEASNSHVAWDPGSFAVSRLMSDALDAPLIAQNFSRLVYDCNRPPDAPDAMPARSEIFDIPGNKDLSEGDRASRIAEVYTPFHAAISDFIEQRMKAGRRPVLVTIHTFTPVYHGKPRAVELGILHDKDSRLADALLAAAEERSSLKVERNEPYGPQHGVTHTLQKHALPLHLLNVMIEIRNDLACREEDRKAVGAQMVAMLQAALDQVAGMQPN
tara:strand:- start:79735 stop:80544 length:810 start_codon:yes stop_codon:yes gene_type:complete